MKRLTAIAAFIAALLMAGGGVSAETIHSKWPRSDALVFYDTHNARYLQALGSDVIQYLQPFNTLPVDDTTGNPTEWTLTLVDGAVDGLDVTGLDSTAGGYLIITTNDAENDGQCIQLKGEAFQMTVDSPLYFGIKLQIDDATETDFIAGLCITDGTLLAALSDGAYFRKVDGSLNVATVSELNSAEEENLAMGVMVNSTNITLEFIAESTGSIKYFIDGALVATHSTTLPTDEVLTPSIHFLTGDASANNMRVDWLRVIQLR